jgi:predicted GTPase
MNVIVGTTGCGKSALINYLMKNDLKYEKKGAGKY